MQHPTPTAALLSAIDSGGGKTMNSTVRLPTAARLGASLVFTYTGAHDAAYLNPAVEFAAELSGPRTTAAAGNATIAVAPGTTADIITVSIPKDTHPRLFARLKVDQPWPPALRSLHIAGPAGRRAKLRMHSGKQPSQPILDN